MKKRGETFVLGGILATFILAGSALTAYLGSRPGTKQTGDPADVTGVLQAERLTAGDLPKRGSQNPRFTLVEFADFQCESCSKAAPLVDELLERRGNLQHIFRHFPLPSHEKAQAAAIASEAARDLGKFWEMHDALFLLQDNWINADHTLQAITAVAMTAGADEARFTGLLSESQPKFASRVKADMESATAHSVETTPSFFLITPSRVWAAVGPEGLRRLIADEKYWQ